MIEDTPTSLGLNIITQIGISAIDELGNCVQVQIDAARNCTPVITTSGGVVNDMRYSSDGIMVSKIRNRARVSVPGCGTGRLVVWVTCQAGDMLRLDITRGVGLTPTSHGLLGELIITIYFYQIITSDIYNYCIHLIIIICA